MKTEVEIEKFIRDEMNHLDMVTGISTIYSPIFITDSYNLVGTYSPNTYPDCFSFSKKFFTDEEIDEKILKYIVRHEYAHCLCFRLYQQRGHGWWFKYCCEKIECPPNEEIYNFLMERSKLYISRDKDKIQTT